eukprot:COSAG06_NODE_32044_length_512_cov_0.857143_1_plen_37_part_10
MKAAAGYSVFCRQDFVGIDYGVETPVAPFSDSNTTIC